MKGKRNPVAQHMNEFNKPKTFRNRKKKAKMDGEFGDKPKHQPYKRDNHSVEADDDFDNWLAEMYLEDWRGA